jgi:hypothetical protein
VLLILRRQVSNWSWPAFLREIEATEKSWIIKGASPGPGMVGWIPQPAGQFTAMLMDAMAASQVSRPVFLDAGCVDADSEYLAPDGWHRISEYRGGAVMQYDPATGEGSFVNPSRYIVRACQEFYRIRTKYGVDQKLSADHRILFWGYHGTGRVPVQEVWRADQFAAEHERLRNGIKGFFRTSFTPVLDTKIPLSDAQIRVQVMVNADAWLRPGKTVRAQLKVKKPRKVQRARLLLQDADIAYREARPDARGMVRFSFVPPLPDKSP